MELGGGEWRMRPCWVLNYITAIAAIILVIPRSGSRNTAPGMELKKIVCS